MTFKVQYTFPAVALLLLSGPGAALPLEAAQRRASIEQLLEHGAKNTPQAIAAAQSLYDELQRQRPGDANVDYAYAVVLLGQHRYADANRQLAALIQKQPGHLRAYRLKIWADMLAKSYVPALEDMLALAKKFPRGPAGREAPASGIDDKFFQDSAMLLGQMCGFLEGPRADAVSAAKVKNARVQIAKLVGAEHWGSFEEGRTDIAERYKERRLALARMTDAEEAAFQKKLSGQEKRVSLEKDDFERRKEDTLAKSGSLIKAAEELQKIDAELSRLKDALAVVEARSTLVRAEAEAVSTRAAEPGGTGLPNEVAASWNRQLDGITKQMNFIKAQASTLLARRTLLVARGRIEGSTVQKQAGELAKADKQIKKIEKKLQRPGEPPRSAESKALAAQLRSLNAYEEFSPDDEHEYLKRVLAKK